MRNLSIRARLHIGASVVMLTFFCLAGVAVQGVYSDHLRKSHFERLQSAIYMLIAITEVGPSGKLILPATIAEPLLSVPHSGLYAQIENPSHNEQWRSPSALQQGSLPMPQLKTGVWQHETMALAGREYLASAYQVRWEIGEHSQTVRFAVFEDTRRYAAQLAQFQRALWGWLVAAAICLLIAQALLLRWGLSPMRRLESELAAIENGEQKQVNGIYPREIAPLAQRLNRLVEQEHARQQRYREALADLAHSLKTPLAILRAEQDSSDAVQQRQTIAEQITRMDHIVQHQLGRAAMRGQTELAPVLALAPIAQRLITSMQKVHAARELAFSAECDASLQWPIDEGDAFEIIGNVLDNAGKWARSRVALQMRVADGQLNIIIDDDGPGFSDTQAPLQRGIRLDERVAGHGIGLSVVADIIHAYQGQIELGRGALGGGRVTMILPDLR
ncbi:ATP-binding protein [Chitinibacter sp. SCUT-21]|uniref:ATP-binding protein n=1 Tax=Chitinibacter sp. SCUT-21 TaxID=2970891 RepID=UPI0035A6AEF3